jgi:hypothetical protein
VTIEIIDMDTREAQPQVVQATEGEAIELKRTYCKVCMTICGLVAELVLTANVDPDMMRGVYSIPHGHYHANVNNLTSTDDMDPLGGMALYSGRSRPDRTRLLARHRR